MRRGPPEAISLAEEMKPPSEMPQKAANHVVVASAVLGLVEMTRPASLRSVPAYGYLLIYGDRAGPLLRERCERAPRMSYA